METRIIDLRKKDVKNPVECNSKEIDAFYKLLLSGGQITNVGLKNLIKRAKLLGFCYINDALAGIAAIKNPDEIYKVHKFKITGLAEETAKYQLEYGWAATKDKYRGWGICQVLTKKLLNEAGPENIYAIASVDQPSDAFHP